MKIFPQVVAYLTMYQLKFELTFRGLLRRHSLWTAPYWLLLFSLPSKCVSNRYLPRFFGQVGHQTTYAYIGNKHFFTKSCHRQTYQNYEQRPQRLQNFDFQSHFSASKTNGIVLIFFCEEY